MTNKWTIMKFGVVLFALPLVATTAASAHNWILDSQAISLDQTVVATAADASIGSARIHTVSPDAEGQIQGRIAKVVAGSTVGVGDLKVQFCQNGKVVAETVTDAAGTFAVDNLFEGSYSFTAKGEAGIAAYGVEVVKSDKHSSVMEAMAVANVSIVDQLVSSQRTVASNIVKTEAADRDSSSRIQIEHGVLKGKVHAFGGVVEAAAVSILKDGVAVAQTTTDSLGRYEVSDIKPGFYEFVAVGSQGYAVVSFEAVEKSAQTNVALTAEPVAFQDGGTDDEMDTTFVAFQDFPVDGSVQVIEEIVYLQQPVYQQFAPIEYASQEIVYGGAVGGTAPGPTAGRIIGGSRGGGRLARLALLGGLTVGIIAIADGDDSDPGDGSPNGS